MRREEAQERKRKARSKRAIMARTRLRMIRRERPKNCWAQKARNLIKKERRDWRQKAGIGNKIKIRDGFENGVKGARMNIIDEFKIIDGVEEAKKEKTDSGEKLEIIVGFGNSREKAKTDISDNIKITEGFEEAKKRKVNILSLCCGVGGSVCTVADVSLPCPVTPLHWIWDGDKHRIIDGFEYNQRKEKTDIIDESKIIDGFEEVKAKMARRGRQQDGL